MIKSNMNSLLSVAVQRTKA